MARRFTARTARIIDNDDVVEGIVLLRKGANADSALDGIHDKMKELNERILPPGVKVVPFLDRSDLVHLHHPYRFAQPDRGNHTGRHHPLPVPGECPRRADCGADHSVLPVVRIHLSRPPAHSRQPAVAGRAGFRHGGGWRGRDGGEHRAAHGTPGRVQAGHGPHSRGCARSPAAGFLRHRHYHHRVPADLHPAERGRPAVQAHGLDRRFCAAGRADLLHGDGAGAVELPLPRGHARVAQPGDGVSDGALQVSRAMGRSQPLVWLWARPSPACWRRATC